MFLIVMLMIMLSVKEYRLKSEDVEDVSMKRGGDCKDLVLYQQST